MDPNKNPETLQNKVQFDLRFFLFRRGVENMETLKKDEFQEMMCEVKGKDGKKSVLKYITKTTDELTKNHRSSDSASSSERGYLPENRQNPSICPVYSWNKYISHLHPDNPWLFQTPNMKSTPKNNIWYTKGRVGKNTLAGFMRRLSEKIQLSQLYTNHDIRATGVTVLIREGFSNADIKACSGHKSDSSLSVYKTVSTEDKLKCATSLMNSVSNTQKIFTEDGLPTKRYNVGDVTVAEGMPWPHEIHVNMPEPSELSKQRMRESRDRYQYTAPRRIAPCPSPMPTAPKQPRLQPIHWPAEAFVPASNLQPALPSMTLPSEKPNWKQPNIEVLPPSATVSIPEERRNWSNPFHIQQRRWQNDSVRKVCNNYKKLQRENKELKLKLLPAPAQTQSSNTNNFPLPPPFRKNANSTPSPIQSSSDEEFSTPPEVIQTRSPEKKASDNKENFENSFTFDDDITEDELVSIMEAVEKANAASFYTSPKRGSGPIITSPPTSPPTSPEIDVVTVSPETKQRELQCFVPAPDDDFQQNQTQQMKNSMFQGCQIGQVHFHIHKK